jgi:hypothetical protein
VTRRGCVFRHMHNCYVLNKAIEVIVVAVIHFAQSEISKPPLSRYDRITTVAHVHFARSEVKNTANTCAKNIAAFAACVSYYLCQE